MKTLATDRLDLRPWSLADADFAFDLYSRWEVQRYVGRTPRVMTDRADALALVQRLGGFEHPVHGFWVVVPREAERPVGTILLKSIPASGTTEPLEPSGDTEIGWHFHPDAWGNGYATEAASAVLERAFGAGLPKVVAVTRTDNTASQRVCERIGMRYEGLTDRYYNTECDLFVREAGT
ncbi:GNAT family N-acetyltransferase [Leifsonia sp. 2MCAF36]|uniref:GNAT family N-acetyltransferase n=1 Tax=Leifsonia sp. 2MCAF36 TaxID=3232988 RepID=UPI003F966528